VLASGSVIQPADWIATAPKRSLPVKSSSVRDAAPLAVACPDV